MATIKIYSNQYTAGALTMENTGNLTRQDINNFLDSKNITYNDSVFTVRQNKVELNRADSQVPAGDIHIMISAAKTKAGGFKSDVREALDIIQEQLDALKAEFAEKVQEIKDYSSMSQEDREAFEELNSGQY